MEFSDVFYRVIRKHWPPIRGPPLRTGSTDYLRSGPRTTPTHHPQNRIKITYRFSNTSLVSAKFRALRWEKCNRPGFSLGPKFIIVYCHFLCCGYKYAWKTGKTLGSLEMCAALHFIRHFARPILPLVRELVPGFAICSAEFQLQSNLSQTWIIRTRWDHTK